MRTTAGGHENLFENFGRLKQFITQIQNKLKRIVESHMYKGNCTKKEAEFLMSKMFIYEVPHFYIIWKILKKNNRGTTNCSRIQLDCNACINFRRTPLESILFQIRKHFK